jgi:hypothetical protein
VWEISDAEIRGDSFPFSRVFSPILVLIVIAIFEYFYIKIFGIY